MRTARAIERRIASVTLGNEFPPTHTMKNKTVVIVFALLLMNALTCLVVRADAKAATAAPKKLAAASFTILYAEPDPKDPAFIFCRSRCIGTGRLVDDARVYIRDQGVKAAFDTYFQSYLAAVNAGNLEVVQVVSTLQGDAPTIGLLLKRN